MTRLPLLLLVLGVSVYAACPPDDEGAFTLVGPERKLGAIEKTYAEMSPLKYDPPADRWAHIPGAIRRLHEGPSLRVVMLGDSIVNDTSRSSWELLVGLRYPKCKVEKVTSVRGSTGCWWYKEEGRVKKYVLDHKPDLVMIGGVSHRDDLDSIRDVIRQIRAGCKAEIIVMTGAFARVDPRDDKHWTREIDPKGGDYRAKLMRFAAEEKVEFLDMTGPWGQYVRDSGKELEWFKRDEVHANERGEQILGRILAAWFGPKKED